MNKQPSKNSSVYSTIVSLCVALPLCIVIWVSKEIVWPVLRFCAKLIRKQIVKALMTSKVVKPPKSTLPTPDIFKGAPNLARAKPVRF